MAVDLTFGAAPDPQLTWLTIVKLDLLSPENGVAVGVEAEVLDAIQEEVEEVANTESPRLLGRLLKRPTTDRFRYVGRVTGGGARLLYFYGTAPIPKIVYKRVFAIREYSLYDVGSLEKEDPRLATYWEDLHPGRALNGLILGDAQLDEREAQGDDLSREREVEHSVWFPTAEDRERFVERMNAEDEGRVFRLQRVDSAEGDGGRFGVDVTCTHALEKLWVHIYTVALARHAGRCGGTYEGWGALVVPAGASVPSEVEGPT